VRPRDCLIALETIRKAPARIAPDHLPARAGSGKTQPNPFLAYSMPSMVMTLIAGFMLLALPKTDNGPLDTELTD
jgi:hypothetical protein